MTQITPFEVDEAEVGYALRIEGARRDFDETRHLDPIDFTPPAPSLDLAEWRVRGEEQALGGWQHAYTQARAGIGAANAVAARYRRKGFDAAGCRRLYLGLAMRALNEARRGLVAAERRLAVASTALTAMQAAEAPAFLMAAE